jgi:imidazolonepropionase-like amidohydrolase
MTPLDAIRSATLAAADLLGVTDRGAIEPHPLSTSSPSQEIR